jgi:hypothetical protein
MEPMLNPTMCALPHSRWSISATASRAMVVLSAVAGAWGGGLEGQGQRLSAFLTHAMLLSLTFTVSDDEITLA